MGKRIAIFLGSSIIELQEEREKIKSMITDINSKLMEREIFIYVLACEQKDFIYHGCRSQDEINLDVEKSDYSIFLFHKSIGKYTKEEFYTAVRHYNETKVQPKIIVMFKDTDNTLRTPELIQFKEELETKHEYYYLTYKNGDEASQVIANLINYQGDLFSYKNGEVFLDNEKIFDLNKNDAFLKNEYRIAIHHKMHQLDEAYQNASTEIKEKINQKKEKLQKEYASVTNTLSKILLDVYDSVGFEYTKEYAKAIAYVKEGKTNDAQRELEYHFSKRRLEQNQEMDDMMKVVHHQYKSIVKENQLLIDLKRLHHLDKQEVDNIHQLYQDTIQLEQRYGQEPVTEYDYGNFLYAIKEYDDAFDHLSKYVAYAYFKSMYDQSNLYILAKGLMRLGTIYSHVRQFEDAKTCYQAVADIHENLMAKEGNIYVYERADAYNKLGNVYDDLKNYEKGEYYHNQAIAIYQKYLEKKPAICGYELGYSYNKQGNIFRHKAMDVQDETIFQKAIQYYKMNEDCLNTYCKNHENYFIALATNQKSLGLTYLAWNKPEEAFIHLNQSVNYYQHLSEQSVLKIGFSYAKVLFHLSEAMYALYIQDKTIDFDEDDIMDRLRENQHLLHTLYEMKNNLRDVIFELIRSYELMDKVRKKQKYSETIKGLKEELRQVNQKKFRSVLKIGF